MTLTKEGKKECTGIGADYHVFTSTEYLGDYVWIYKCTCGKILTVDRKVEYDPNYDRWVKDFKIDPDKDDLGKPLNIINDVN